MVRSDQETSVSFGKTVVKLLSFVVLPIIVAQLARLNPKLATWADNNKSKLGLSSQIGLLSIVFLGSIQSGIRIRENDSELSVTELFVASSVCLLLHVVVLFLGGYWLHRWGIDSKRADRSRVCWKSENFEWSDYRSP